MADKGTRNTSIAFGDYEITVSMKKAAFSRDLTTELVDAAGRKIKGGGGGGGGRRTPDTGAGEARAVRLSDDSVVRLPQERLEAIEEGSKDRYSAMQVVETIDYRQVPTERIVASYWLQPLHGSVKGLRLLAEGLKDSGRVAVVKWCSSSREKLGVIRVRHFTRRGAPLSEGFNDAVALLLSEITFANDFRAPDEDALAINDVEVEQRSVEAAARLVKSFARKPGRESIDTASDTAVDARLALYEEVCDGKLADELERSTEGVEA